MLRIEDRLAIQDLYARYCACMDTGDIKGWANSWTEDGVFDSYQYHDGRARIEEYGWAFMKRLPDMKWTNGQHWNNNLIVEGDGRTADALCYLVVIGKMKDSGELRICVQGVYRDNLVKLPSGEWKFTRRKLMSDMPGPDQIPKKI
jgi:ketosteroid isomerase-like protein